MQIIPFEVQHAAQISPRPFEGREMAAVDWRRQVEIYHRGGPAWTGMIDGQIVACCGIFVLPGGVGEGWLITSDLCARFPLSFHRAFRENIDRISHDMRLQRLQVYVALEHQVSRRWLERLGFELEPTPPLYVPEGGEYYRYVRLCP